VVGDQHADGALLEEADDALDVEHRDRVDASEGLVQQDEGGLAAQGARDLQAPALAARERDRRVLAQVRDVQVLEQLLQARLDVAARQALQLEHRLHVLLDRELAERRVLLRQVGDAQARARVDRQVRELAPVELDAPGVRGDQADDHVKAGGLARAVGAQQPDHLAAGHLERHVLHHAARLVALVQVFGAQQAHCAPLAAGFLGWITARTRSPGAAAGAPLALDTEKNSERWS
jgi:hypothetical protein